MTYRAAAHQPPMPNTRQPMEAANDKGIFVRMMVELATKHCQEKTVMIDAVT